MWRECCRRDHFQPNLSSLEKARELQTALYGWNREGVGDFMCPAEPGKALGLVTLNLGCKDWQDLPSGEDVPSREM
jgi:hypothetical protein